MTSEKIWKPHHRQELVASLPDSIFEALYGGAAGGGKSELLMMLPLIRNFHENPRFKGILFRRTFPELEAEIIVRSFDWYRPFGAEYNQDRKRWKFPSGAIMQFGHVEYEADVRKYDSAEYNYMAFDELTSFTEAQYIYLSKTRCRSSSSSLPAIVRSATNPGNVGHAWVRDRFINPCPYGTIMIDKKTGDKRIFIQSFAQDNPHLMENDPGYVRRLEGLPEAEKRAKLHGAWDTFEGQVFDDYREVPKDDEPENACHLYTPFLIPDWWLRFLAIDWGYTAMTCALWGALSPDDRLYIYREYTGKEKKTSFWANEVGELSRDESFTDIVLCQSAWQQRGEDLTIEEKLFKVANLRARRADNDRIAGKLMLQEYLRWKPIERKKINSEEYNSELASRILRQQGIEPYKKYLANFDEIKKEDNLPRLQIHPDCKELRKAIPLCIYDKKSNTTNKPAEDVREFAGDDPYDTVRYLVCSVDRYLGSLKDHAAQREKVNEVIQDLQVNHDWNAYYRRMERVERTNFSLVKPVQRFHRTRV